ncbi:MAG: radical SAM family heme chaperone HemW [bacterium]|nr:radical SAM family heme chaperone HemW [bacterium]
MSLAIYLHYPFCTNHCSYCDFYKCLIDRDQERSFYRAVAQELKLAVKKYQLEGAQVDTIFIGGGTPSLTSPELLTNWINQLRKRFELSENLEFSIECNPESVNLERLEQFQELGVTRPTFGIQSFDTEILKILGRRHNPHHSQQAVYLTNVLGFDTFGVDLIFGLPGQKNEDLARDLAQLFALDPPHISFYELTVEPDTALERMVENKQVRLPDNDYSFALGKSGYEKMTKAGYKRYEFCSFAKPGHECRHNLKYWEGEEYLGLGPSAHSFIGNKRFNGVADLEGYISSLEKGELPHLEDQSTERERITEAIMLGLRLAKGIDRVKFSKRFGLSLEECMSREQYHLLVESGHLIPDKGFLRLSDEGMFIADEIARRLIPD